jgi:hypothetical protein
MKELATLRAASLRTASPPAGSGALTRAAMELASDPGPGHLLPRCLPLPGEVSRRERGGAGFPGEQRGRGGSSRRAGRLAVIR